MGFGKVKHGLSYHVPHSRIPVPDCSNSSSFFSQTPASISKNHNAIFLSVSARSDVNPWHRRLVNIFHF